MYQGQKFGKTRHALPLRFRNPYISTGFHSPFSFQPIVAPITRDGMTSIENSERARFMKQVGEWKNSGMLKQMQQLGVIPDNLGVDMSEFTGDVSAIPLSKGVSSLEEVQKLGDARRQIERLRTGILSAEDQKKKSLYELYKKKQTKELENSVLKWLATTDEIEEIPPEFREEVSKYVMNNPDEVSERQYNKALAAQKEKKEERLKREREEWERIQERRMAPERTAWDNIGMSRPGVTDVSWRTTSVGAPTAAELERRRLAPLAEAARQAKQAEYEAAQREYENIVPTRRERIDIVNEGLRRNSELSELNRLEEKWNRHQAAMPPLEDLSDEARRKEARFNDNFRQTLNRLIRRIGRNPGDFYGVPSDAVMTVLRNDIEHLMSPERLSAYNRLSEVARNQGAILRNQRRLDRYIMSGHGWRAPRLHKLIRPLKPFVLDQTPMDVVDEQKQALDDRREQYKEQETAQRGVAPSKDNIETAMPKTAAPMMGLFTSKPRISIVPHPFVFPKRKFGVKGVF